MIQFSKLQNFNFTKFNKEELKEFFKNIPESEIAFLCRYNKTIPLFFCPLKWKYHPMVKSEVYYTSIEKIKYNIFLLTHGYYVISMDYVYGILSFIGLGLNMKGKKQSEKVKTISKNSEKILNLQSKTKGENIKIRYKGSGDNRKVHKEDAIKLLYLFEELEKQNVFDWNELNDLPMDYLLMPNIE
jgi:hypothetical protein